MRQIPFLKKGKHGEIPVKALALFVAAFLSACSSSENQNSQISMHGRDIDTKTFYEECKRDSEVFVDLKDMENSECNLKLSLFFLGYAYGELGALSARGKGVEHEDISKVYRAKKQFYNCAMEQGYLVALSPVEPIFPSKGVNLPATFVKWVDQSPDVRMGMPLSQAISGAFLNNCHNNKG